jgi:ATP-dependent exoDNAse (exonuclease V) beta subunit
MTWQAELEALIQETQAQADAVQAKIPKPIASAKPAEQPPAESSRPTKIEPMSWAASGSEREEIKRRVANFKAVQDRMQREREDYFVKTLADARYGPRVASPPRGA